MGQSRCAICESTFHWVKDCPHRDESENSTLSSTNGEDEVETVNMASSVPEDLQASDVTLFTKPDEMIVFVREASGCQVVDTACSRTICGVTWLAVYSDKVTPMMNKSIEYIESSAKFRFEDGEQVRSLHSVRIPAKIGDTVCYIHCEVVEKNIPLLLSNASLKRANASIDLGKDQIVMLGQSIKVETTSRGHYCISLLPEFRDSHCDCNQHLQKSDVLLHLDSQGN